MNNTKLSFLHVAGIALSLTMLLIVLISFAAVRSPHAFSLFKINDTYVKPASWWHRQDLGVKCDLCPNNCFLTEGQKGLCKVRMNKGNILYTEVYNQPVSISIDPIEKKPVFHMLPGSPILSLSTVGCPLKCTFCQNWTISQTYPEQVKNIRLVTPEEIVSYAVIHKIPSIAYTYGEPVSYYEYMHDIARLAHEKGIRNVMVTSGYINEKPLLAIVPYFDVIKVDLKGIDEKFYNKEVNGFLQSVLNTLVTLKKSNVLTEVVNLVVPNRNDSNEDFERLSKWIHDNLGPDTPLFFSRFHPDYKLSNLPPTPVDTLVHARDIALKNGLNFVYIGNAPGINAENTYCPGCGTLLVEREGYLVRKNIIKNGHCPVCGRDIPGIW